MNELKTLKNLLLDLLADEGAQPCTKIKALQVLKIDKDINAPVYIDQRQTILNISIRQNIVAAIKMIDEVAEKGMLGTVVSSPIVYEPAVSIPANYFNVMTKYQYQLIDAAMELAKYNKTKAAESLGISLPAFHAMLKRKEKGIGFRKLMPPREVKNNE